MNSQIKILMAGVSKMNREGTYKAHKHPFYQLNHILVGEYEFEIDGKCYHAQVGDTVLVPKNSVHSITLTSQGLGYYFEIKFSTFSLQDQQLCENSCILTQDDSFSRPLLKEIFDEETADTPDREAIKITYLYAILYKLSAAVRRGQCVNSKYIRVDDYSEPIQSTIRFLEDHYGEHLSLDDIVENTGVRKSTLCGRFKRETGTTVFECLMIIRIRKAVELISFTDLTMAEISEATGFVSLTHFNRVFTKYVMIPPGQYRKHLDSQNLYWKDAMGRTGTSPIARAVLERRKIDVGELVAVP